MCILNAQYEEYYVWFTAHLRPHGYVTIEQVNQALKLIDERMSVCLDKPLPRE
jgi:hypothetical protein